MHDDQVETSVAVVRTLLREQLPRWADLPITWPPRERSTTSTVSATPSSPASRSSRARRGRWKEQRWLPCLAPHLPLTVPTPVALGAPTAAFPHVGSVYEWLDGESSARAELRDPVAAARALSGAVLEISYYRETNPPFADLSRRTLIEVLADGERPAVSAALRACGSR